MSAKPDVNKVALIVWSGDLETTKSTDSQVSDEGLVETVLKSLLENIGKGSVATSQVVSQPRGLNTSSVTASVVPASSERRSNDPTRKLCCPKRLIRADFLKGQPERSTARVHPKVVIHKSNRNRKPLPQISQLQSRAATVSWEDGELESWAPNPAIVADASSEDELAHDTPRPAKPSSLPKAVGLPNQTRHVKRKRPFKQVTLPKSARLSKPTGRASQTATTQIAHLQPIEWVFWVQASDEIGYWRAFSEFPKTTQVLFTRKFSAEHLQKPSHINDYARMLRNRKAYRHRDICVGNMTYWRRNEPSKWKTAGGNKERTCDTCLKAGRFCARMVEVGNVVKLGFFPVAGAGRTGVEWEELRYWAREKKGKKQ